MRVEVYADLTPARLLADDTVRRVAALSRTAGGAVDGLRVMVDDSRGRPRFSVERFEETVRAYGAAGFGVRAVHWPTVGLWDEASWDRVASMREASNLPAVFDLEHNANSPRERASLAAGFREYVPTDSIITTHPGHPLARCLHPVFREYPLEVQAYSTETSGERPGAWQHELLLRYPEVEGMALAAYGQTRAARDMTAEFAMLTAYRACLNDGISTVSYWSLRHVLANRYAYRFLSSPKP